MLVRAKSGTDVTVVSDKTILTKLGPPASGLPLRFYPDRDGAMFSPQWFPDALASKIAQLSPDVVNLHWICNGFLQVETLTKIKQPLVWTLQDMWPLTGGCHYNQECDRYMNSCGACPQLHSHRSSDLSRWVWKRKAKAWKNSDLTIVAPSSWIAECARASSLFHDRRVEVIPFCLDTQKYKPVDRTFARELLNLPQEKQLILFGAISATSDQRKGFYLLLPALQQLSQAGWKDKLELVVFGSSKPEKPIDLGFNSHYLGHFSDDISIAILYSAADVMIVPSVQESFGQTASESLACGTPVVAFNATGLKDIVDHQQNGYLAKPFEVEDLAQGIAWVLENKERHQKLKYYAREKAEKAFPLELQAYQYESLYSEILEAKINKSK
jgi:glycosyltransferase involved in cell wall biosynthesis